MMNTMRQLSLPALVASAVMGLPAAQVAAADAPMDAYKLEGAWVAKAQEAPLQWSFVLVPDASGRRASLHGSIDVPFVLFPEPVDSTPLIGELVMTGPASAKGNAVCYLTVPAAPPLMATIACIGVNRAEFKFTGPGKGTATHQMAYDLPSSDADGDGYLDPGATPAAGPLLFTMIDTWVPSP